ncbi:MAG: ABC transporter permease [Acidobacteriota bacterium]|nr:ABC transporter permease [Acidobacteriota bacterium]
MTWFRILRLAVRALLRARLRTLLSVSGMAVGITAVAVLLGLGAGARQALQDTIEKMGRNLLTVNAWMSETNALRGTGRYVNTLVTADSEAVARQLPGIEAVSPVISGTRNLRWGGRTMNATVNGTTPEYRITKNHVVKGGRFIDEEDVCGGRRVAVVGDQIVRELFMGERPIGETLLVGRIPFTIIGVLEGKGTNPLGGNEDDQIVVPVTTAQRRVYNVDYLTRIFVQVASKDLLKSTTEALTDLLRNRHQTVDFKIVDQTALLAVQSENGASFRRMIGGLAGLALGLGGVGLLSVSLLSVRERRTEIGLQLALGARSRHIMVQYLVESLLVALIGGVLGLVMGACGIVMASSWTQWPARLSWDAVWQPFVLSLVIALAFGAYPAWRAARLDPIVALRSK